MKKTMTRIAEYRAQKFYESAPCPKKIFYHLHELSGWRFYWKALRNEDWKSIKGHIMSNLGLR